MSPPIEAKPTGLPRRLAAIAYDSFILVSIWFVGTIPVVLISSGEAVPANHPLYQMYLLTCSALYFIWPWTHGGQTLGMRSWRVRVCSESGGPVCASAALLRFALATLSWLAFGLGFLAALVDSEQRSWHDRWTHTRLITEST